ncbi:general transcription factor II-I repeat domain-containing protein 2A [Trichonephila clavipes]|nr:general transcription factor II-I repeat domain-containing protein 2A [Trichonephila clavipes]
MFDPSSYANPTPLAHADTSRDVLPRGGTSQNEPTRLKMGSAVGDIARIQICIATRGRKHFRSSLGGIVLKPARNQTCITTVICAIIASRGLWNVLQRPSGQIYSCFMERKKEMRDQQKYYITKGPKEELLGILPLKGQTRGEDIANAVIECMDKHHIPLDKVVSISTDGAKYMTSVRKGYGISDTIINSILAKALNHRQFKEFLFEMESEYADLLFHNKVRWLSRGNVLKRFASLFPEMKAFLLEKSVHYPDLTDDQWIQNFYFMEDVTSHLNQLNRKLQEQGNLIFSILEEVITFENKLSIFAQDFERETLFHFPRQLKHRQEN